MSDHGEAKPASFLGNRAAQRPRERSIGFDELCAPLLPPPHIGSGITLIVNQQGSGDAPSIVAHEIAHAWLRHDRLSLDVTSECEGEAAALTLEWGFDGLGTDIAHLGGRELREAK